jgi:hypothetical protein
MKVKGDDDGHLEDTDNEVAANSIGGRDSSSTFITTQAKLQISMISRKTPTSRFCVDIDSSTVSTSLLTSIPHIMPSGSNQRLIRLLQLLIGSFLD